MVEHHSPHINVLLLKIQKRHNITEVTLISQLAKLHKLRMTKVLKQCSFSTLVDDRTGTRTGTNVCARVCVSCEGHPEAAMTPVGGWVRTESSTFSHCLQWGRVELHCRGGLWVKKKKKIQRGIRKRNPQWVGGGCTSLSRHWVYSGDSVNLKGL